MSGHTPGPWRVVPPEPQETVQELAVKKGDYFIATVHDLVAPLHQNNARLIAAAPDLLAALMHSRETGHRAGSVESISCPDCALGAFAIDKAGGRE